MRPIALISLLIPVAASAAPTETICTLVGRGLIQVDGLLDDWPGVREVTKSGPDRKDAGLAVRCAYDEGSLIMAVNVFDDRVIRSKGKSEDRLVVTLGDGRLEIVPTSGDDDLASRWIDKKGSKIEVADSLQKTGWSVELSIPLDKIPGWTRGTPFVPSGVELSDADQHTANRIEDVVDTGPLALTFESSARNLTAFLTAARARAADITFDKIADVDGEPGLERVVVAGKTLGVLSEGYAFLGLPVASPRDLIAVELVDFGGTGKSSIVVTYREHGGGGSRDVLGIWAAKPDGFARIFAHEIAKQVGTSRLTNRYEIVPRKGKNARGRDLVIQIGEVTGFTAETWNETPAGDMAPILLPWGEKKLETWHFDRDEVSGG
jgi:hypothetical protein